MFSVYLALLVLFGWYYPSAAIPTAVSYSNSTATVGNTSIPPRITLEEHFVSQTFLNSSWTTAGNELDFDLYPKYMQDAAVDMGIGRIKTLDAARIAIQVVSQVPTIHVPPANLCIAANTELAADLSPHADRLAGLALLPMLDPTTAAAELERSVKQLGFLGALIPHHANGRYYDDAFFWPVFAKAQELDVPIYIHPTWVSDDQASHFMGNFSDMMALTLGAYGWVWHADTGLSFLRAWAGGLFDTYPKLKIVLGHDGEGIPF